MVEMKPGPELDRAVAEAIGWETRESDPWERWDEPPMIRTVAVDEAGSIHWIDGGPSVDLNAAFAAAERAFGNGFMVTDHPKISSCIAMLCEGEQYMIPVPPQCTPSRADTPALAICAAILKLKEETT